MRVYVIDGTFSDKYQKQISNIVSQLSAKHDVKLMKVSEQQISYCTGCWDCWVKTPGECAHQDDTPSHVSNLVNTDFVLHITENSLGTITSLTKKSLDKAIPTIHPYLTIVDGESRHKKRYETYPRWGFIYFDPEENKTDRDNVLFYFNRAVMNAKTEVVAYDFLTGKEDAIDEINIIKWFA